MPPYKEVVPKSGYSSLLLFVLALFLLATGDCDNSGKNGSSRGNHAAVVLENQRGDTWRVEVEVARTPEQIKRGLMFRKDLPPDRGMLFVFDEVKVHTFWMKNTYIPLDIIFIAPDKTVAGVVENAEPKTLTPRRIDKPSKWGLEVNAGEADRHHIRPGDRVYFKDVE
ncbi:MAG: DUF192 domain-containing protein [bacterium]